MNKIKEKLTGGSSSSDSNKLQKDYDSSSSTGGTTSKLQNPISSSGTGPTGSAVSSGTPSSYPQNTSGYTSTSGAPSSYPQNTSGYTSTAGGSDRMPGSYVSEEDHIPSSTTSGSTTSPRQPYDPYSSKGQETAARAGTTTSSSRPMEESTIARSRDGGVTNQSSDLHPGYTGSSPSDPRYAQTSSSSDPRYAQTSGDDRYAQTSSTAPTSSSHHYGRDAAIGGGAAAVGAGGLGAYEYNKDQSSSQPLTSSSGQPGQYQDVSYMQQGRQQPMSQDPSMAGAAPGATSTGSNVPGSTSAGGAVPGESPGLTQARKMGGAYEAGYRDAMEHMQAEMKSKGAGSGQAF